MSRNKGKFTWQGLLHFLTHIETDDPSIRRKGELLALFIGLCWGLLNYSVVNTAVVLILHPTYEYTIYLIEDLLVFIPLHIFWRMNKKGKVHLTANLAISFSILVGIFLSDAKYIEYLMVIFALPVGISSFIIRPSSSFWYAGLTATGYTISSLISGYAWEYNLTAVMALFALAFMTWATASQLERTIKRNQTLVDTLKKSNSEIQAAYETTLEGWSRALEVRDRETQGHSKRVTELTLRIARKMGFSEDMLIHIYRGALLHDIGKLGIPDDILHKKGPLTEQEMRIMRLHPQIALDLLSPIDYLKPALNIPRYHHEKWDGTGYPHGLSGETIPLEARIYAIVDVFDALTHDRPYRAAMPTHEALEYIKSEAGKQFDPEVVRVFLSEINNREN